MLNSYKVETMWRVCLILLLFTLNVFSKPHESLLDRIAPIGAVNVKVNEQDDKPMTTLPQGRQNSHMTGQRVYQKYCVICHAEGVAGAPKFRNQRDWQLRQKKGLDVLVQHVLKGFNAMPKKGTCLRCGNEDIKAAVMYMLPKK